MTGWAGLSWGQKATSVFMLLFAALCIAIPVLHWLLDPGAFSLNHCVNALAMASAISATVLNTKNIRGDSRAWQWSTMPKPTRVLYVVSGSSLLAGILLRIFSNALGTA